ncbi:MAG: transposase, partial [Actinobacteria bacterium]|nr:transposase [Actinomycetota bacterium]
IVRRTRLTDRAQRRLWPDWRHHAFLTDLAGPTADVDAFHRRHAEVELAIRDLKEGAGMEHVPSGQFFANGAWLCCAVLAHNLLRWSVTLGRRSPIDELVVARTVRTRLIAIPGRLVNRGGTPTLRGPLHWPWAGWFTSRLAVLRALPDTG